MRTYHIRLTAGSMIVQASTFGPFPDQEAAEAVQTPTTSSEKLYPSVTASSASSEAALRPARMEGNAAQWHAHAEAGSEIPGDRDTWEENVDGGREEDGRRTRLFRYETDGGVRLAGGPLDGSSSTEVDRLNDSMVVTLPPPYSRY